MYMFNISKFISIPLFLTSFIFGLFFLYIWGDDLKPIYVYPTPEKVYDTIYKDKANRCYVYKAILTECTDDVSTFPIQQ